MTSTGDAVERVALAQRVSALLARADALRLSRRPEAAAVYRRALALDAGLFDAWCGLGACQLASFSYGAAEAALERALQLRPEAAGVRCSLAEALFQQGRVDDAVRQYLQAAEASDAEIAALALANLACIAPGAASLDNAAVLAVRRRWAEHVGRQIRPLTPAPHDPSRKLRIGYVSAFFGRRNWMKPVFGVINAHDRDRFEIHMLTDGDGPSADSGYRDDPEDRIWLLGDLANEALARHIIEARLDVLVDLNLYSAQRRLPLFLYRPARVQIGWFNAYATTGIRAFDWLVGDAATLPPEEEPLYGERIHRVPGTYLAFQVAYPVPEVAPPPCLETGHLTFGVLASAYKLSEAAVAAWSRILGAAAGAKLLLKNNILDDASNREALQARFARHGIAPERLLLEGGEEHFRFLASYARVDVALDPFPYNGGTTTMEALWQGVPVLSFNGDRWAGRTSRSLLLAAGLPDWVVPDMDAYVAGGIRLATADDTPQRLLRLRDSMRERLLASPACDSAGLCRALENFYVAAAGPERTAALAEAPAAEQ